MTVDLHMHTGYSADADTDQTPMQKIQACVDKKIDIAALTDHFEFYHNMPPSENKDVEACIKDAWETKRAFDGKIEVLAGIEIGQIYASETAASFIKSHKFDVVIGSLHAMPNDLDIYFHDFENLDCDKFLKEYFNELIKLEQYGGFDVLAHIDYPLRVMRHGDYLPSFDNYMDRVEDVLKECVSRGYALELNAAGITGWQKKPGPPQNVLYEYKRMGGVRISIGSDSHSLDTVGRGIDKCVQNAKDAGFYEVTVFRNREACQAGI